MLTTVPCPVIKGSAALKINHFVLRNMKYHLHVSGYSTCSAYVQAKKALLGLTAIYPDDFSVTVDERK
jgi:hypothetical protein